LDTPIIQEITLCFRRCPCRWSGIYPIIRFHGRQMGAWTSWSRDGWSSNHIVDKYCSIRVRQSESRLQGEVWYI